MCWHKWTKWKTYTEDGIAQVHPFSKEMISYSEERQRRNCVKCGMTQDRKVKKEK